MALPKYDELYVPFLTVIKDGQLHTAKAVAADVAALLHDDHLGAPLRATDCCRHARGAGAGNDDVGFEIDEDYCRAANERLEQEQAQIRLFDLLEQEERKAQATLFAE